MRLKQGQSAEWACLQSSVGRVGGLRQASEGCMYGGAPMRQQAVQIAHSGGNCSSLLLCKGAQHGVHFCQQPGLQMDNSTSQKPDI